ncbi:MAG TPA: hypothetical protein HA349_09110 [Methanotrichaceae archaeon]|nr:hypothetical protein [Methanotrichaceae archaeon]
MNTLVPERKIVTLKARAYRMLSCSESARLYSSNPTNPVAPSGDFHRDLLWFRPHLPLAPKP